MAEQTNNPNSNGETHSISISALVNYVLLILGLAAELFAIKLIINASIPDLAGANKFFMYASVVMMLFHQFMIIRNFHILDHISPKDYEANSIGNWVSKCRIEDGLRFLLFFLFAALTGEIIYLIIVSSKTIPFLHSFMVEDKSGLYNLSWITPMYLISALSMSFFMLLWDWIGLIHDWNETPKINWRKFQFNDKIVYHPLSSPFYTFIITDFIALYFWGLLNYIVFSKPEQKDIMIWLGFLFLFYAVAIMIRVWGEWKVNSKRLSQFVKLYVENTSWWIPKPKAEDKKEIA